MVVVVSVVVGLVCLVYVPLDVVVKGSVVVVVVVDVVVSAEVDVVVVVSVVVVLVVAGAVVVVVVSALPVYGDDGEIERYNVFHASMLIRCASDEKMYLYDIIDIKKETSNSFD